uniref:Uncharacterized protein n=1 Tax=Nelumbo nucifera TaxID=4432 RepID=A0A822Z4X6_NELNU|nr:TPA_asm: hypothetical protein HUJ06_008697 [Nelumbo nucifera]
MRKGKNCARHPMSTPTRGSNQSQPSSSHRIESQSAGSRDSSSDSGVVDNNTSHKRIRGPTRCLDVWTLFEGKQIPIESNKYTQVIGDTSQKLITFMGTMTRNGSLAPITYNDWRSMPKDKKEEIWKIIKVC